MAKARGRPTNKVRVVVETFRRVEALKAAGHSQRQAFQILATEGSSRGAVEHRWKQGRDMMPRIEALSVSYNRFMATLEFLADPIYWRTLGNTLAFLSHPLDFLSQTSGKKSQITAPQPEQRERDHVRGR